MNPNKELIDTAAVQYIRQHRDPNESYPGYEESHLRNVAQLTELASLAAGYHPRETELSRIAGWFHDFERSSNETREVSDATVSADAALEFTHLLHQEGLYFTQFTHRIAVADAISDHGRPPGFFTDKPDLKQWNLSERVLAALFVADKMEANGVWVIARRSQFVAGARLQAEDADLPEYGLQPNQDEVKAVLLESALRIAFINPEGLYPEVFRPLTSKMYRPQRDFIHGLLDAKGMNIEDYARMILETRSSTPGHPNYLQARGITIHQDPISLSLALKVNGGLSNLEINRVTKDAAKSAVEAVNYFSKHYQTPLEQLVADWKPKNKTSSLWHADMMSYVSGEWFNQIREQLIHK